MTREKEGGKAASGVMQRCGEKRGIEIRSIFVIVLENILVWDIKIFLLREAWADCAWPRLVRCSLWIPDDRVGERFCWYYGRKQQLRCLSYTVYDLWARLAQPVATFLRVTTFRGFLQHPILTYIDSFDFHSENQNTVQNFYWLWNTIFLLKCLSVISFNFKHVQVGKASSLVHHHLVDSSSSVPFLLMVDFRNRHCFHSCCLQASPEWVESWSVVAYICSCFVSKFWWMTIRWIE